MHSWFGIIVSNPVLVVCPSLLCLYYLSLSLAHTTGACEVVLGHPLDLVKVRMQTAQGTTTTNAAATTTTTTMTTRQGIVSMWTTVLHQQGPRGLFRGISAPLVSVAPAVAVDFWAYHAAQEWIVRLLQQQKSGVDKNNSSNKNSWTVVLGAAALSAFPSVLISTPSDRIKCILQTNPRYGGMVDCAKSVYRRGGIRGLYRGMGATLLRDLPGHVLWFGVYEFSKQQLTLLTTRDDDTTIEKNNASSSSWWIVLWSGGLAGMAYTAGTMPMDVLKSRVQASDRGGLWETYQILRRDGSFFRGLWPALIRSFPANAVCFWGMETAHSLLDRVL